ncbi:MAG: EscU/YscU/HrcU family type III secretion system export apparatus switch protein [Holosporales bacterium]
MAENREEDKGSKTEEPSFYRRQKAREKGNIAQSREIFHFLVLCVWGGSLWWTGAPLAKEFSNFFKPWIANVGQIPCDAFNLQRVLMWGLGETFQLCLWFFLSLYAVLLLGGGLQTQFLITFEPLKPKGERISLLSGFKRIFSLRNFLDFFKGFGKLGMILFVAFFIFDQSNFPIQHFGSLAPQFILPEACRLVLQILISLISAMGILAALDYAYQWARVFRDLYMSRQELKDEHKNLEKDPSILSRQRQMQKELGQMRSLGNKIPRATVVITNPTHYAVALRWNPNEMSAPQVIAKGTDRVAQHIRELAKEHFVPVVENPPLARALYKNVGIDQEILPHHYRAVSEIIRYVMRVQGYKRVKS